MRPAHGLAQLLGNLGTGVTLPVLSLILLARGGRLETLGLLLGLYSATVILAELPTGIFADRWGRRSAYLLSCLLNGLGALLLLWPGAFPLWLLAAAMVLNGLGRAFSSGSLDALILEQTVAARGAEYLPRVVSQLSIYQCSGIGLGALLCSLLPAEGGYCWQLATKAVLAVMTLLLALAYLRESKKPPQERPTLAEQLRSYGPLMGQRPLQALLLCVAAGCVVLAGLEAYWQPVLSGLAGLAQPQRLLGLLTALGFGMTVLGSWLAGRWTAAANQPHHRWRLYLTLLSATGLCLLALSFQQGTVGFSLWYLAFYLTLGATNVPEQTILNHHTPNAARASMLSLYSFGGQVGGLTANLGAAALLTAGLTVPALWRLGSLLCVGACMLLLRPTQKL